MKRTLWLAAIMFVAVGRPAWAQQNEIAALKAELQRQQEIIAQLMKKVDDLEKKQSEVPTREEVKQETGAEQDTVNSLRETFLGRVNLNGYYNFRFAADGSQTPHAFQQNHLGLLLGKQLRRFNFFMELELQNVPHHPEIQPSSELGGETHAAGEETTRTDISGEGQVAVENAWMEYNHNRFLNVRVGKQLSPQYWWQHHYPNLILSTDQPIYLRELFPPELVGVMVQGSVGQPVGASEFALGYQFYVSNNDFEGNSQSDLRDGKSWGARVQFRLPTGGLLKRLDVAGDVYRGRVALATRELLEDSVFGIEEQLEVGRFQLNSEYARGRLLTGEDRHEEGGIAELNGHAHGGSQGSNRSGFYVQPALRLSQDWLAFYRVERLDSARIRTAEERHLAGINFRPYPQIAVKAEYYRARPLKRSFIPSDDERKPFNGFATAAVFFF